MTVGAQVAMGLPPDAFHECSSDCTVGKSASLISFGGSSTGILLLWAGSRDPAKLAHGVRSPGTFAVCRSTGCVHFCSNTEKCTLSVASAAAGHFTCPFTKTMTDAPPSEAERDAMGRCLIKTPRTLPKATMGNRGSGGGGGPGGGSLDSPGTGPGPGTGDACLKLTQLNTVQKIGERAGAKPSDYFQRFAHKIVSLYSLLNKHGMLSFLSAPPHALYFGAATLFAEGFLLQEESSYRRVIPGDDELKGHLSFCLPRLRHRAITKIFVALKDCLRRLLMAGLTSPHDVYLDTTFSQWRP